MPASLGFRLLAKGLVFIDVSTRSLPVWDFTLGVPSALTQGRGLLPDSILEACSKQGASWVSSALSPSKFRESFPSYDQLP